MPERKRSIVVSRIARALETIGGHSFFSIDTGLA
jgi:hypothetical protein